jgi:hypothetical protein
LTLVTAEIGSIISQKSAFHLRGKADNVDRQAKRFNNLFFDNLLFFCFHNFYSACELFLSQKRTFDSAAARLEPISKSDAAPSSGVE